MFDGHYDLWRQNRFNYIVSQLGQDYFQDKTLLELGGGYGDLGAMFAALGAKVTSVDARSYYAGEGKRRYPDMDFVTQNLEEDFSNLGTYDIVLHTGLLYHISNVDKHIQYLSQVIGGILILETECCDSSDPFFAIYHQDRFDYDQSYTGGACAPSPAFVERLLDCNDIHHVRHDHSGLNSYCVDYDKAIIIYHRYNWVVSETKHKGPTHRRLWICHKEPQKIIKRLPFTKSMTPKLKTAICLSGHLRLYKETAGNLQTFLLNNSHLDCDVFIHTWKSLDRNARRVKESDIMAFYNPKQLVIERERQFAITPLMHERNFNQRDVNGLLCMFYKIKACNDLKIAYEKENHFTYDCVVRIRPDIRLSVPVPIDLTTDLNKLYIPQHGDYGGVNDQFAYSNSKNMDIYSSTYDCIDKYLKDGFLLNPEFFTEQTIKENGIQLERPDIPYDIIWYNKQVWNNLTRHTPR